MAFKKIDDSPKSDFPPREMIKGDWKCADCQTPITELPFTPAPDRPIYCKECWSKRRTQKFGK